MKVTLAHATGTFACTPDGAVVDVRGMAACPVCKVAPVRARGTGKRIESHDTYAANAVFVCCGAPAGVLRVKVDTIFGIEEDERVLAGPWRVY